eukprot:GABV01010247.1.p1 GENE.GABV01010247.1~~GABV01010247.1.p1  ORF type:complete len:104 (+),score=20.90 GABV01010247.1:200-511(+)
MFLFTFAVITTACFTQATLIQDMVGKMIQLGNENLKLPPLVFPSFHPKRVGDLAPLLQDATPADACSTIQGIGSAAVVTPLSWAVCSTWIRISQIASPKISSP